MKFILFIIRRFLALYDFINCCICIIQNAGIFGKECLEIKLTVSRPRKHIGCNIFISQYCCLKPRIVGCSIWQAIVADIGLELFYLLHHSLILRTFGLNIKNSKTILHFTAMIQNHRLNICTIRRIHCFGDHNHCYFPLFFKSIDRIAHHILVQQLVVFIVSCWKNIASTASISKEHQHLIVESEVFLSLSCKYILCGCRVSFGILFLIRKQAVCNSAIRLSNT